MAGKRWTWDFFFLLFYTWIYSRHHSLISEHLMKTMRICAHILKKNGMRSVCRRSFLRASFQFEAAKKKRFWSWNNGGNLHGWPSTSIRQPYAMCMFRKVYQCTRKVLKMSELGRTSSCWRTSLVRRRGAPWTSVDVCVCQRFETYSAKNAIWPFVDGRAKSMHTNRLSSFSQTGVFHPKKKDGDRHDYQEA